MTRSIATAAVSIFASAAALGGQAGPPPTMHGSYLGEELPGRTPRVFAPAILSRSKPDWAFGPTFTPDGRELCFSSFDTRTKKDRILCLSREADVWTGPAVASFSGTYSDNDARISPDGLRLLFRSRRPLPGRTGPEEHFYTWFVIRTTKGWGEPRPVQVGGVPLRTADLGIANDGTLYFAHHQEGVSGIFRSRPTGGAYSAPERVSTGAGSERCTGDTFVAPDEDYLVATCWGRPDSRGESDLYISFRRPDGSWTDLENMGGPINSERNESNPTLTPDGEFFLYTTVDVSADPIRCDTYWVDAAVIEDLRPDP